VFYSCFNVFNLGSRNYFIWLLKDKEILESDQITADPSEVEEAHPQSETEAGTGVLEETEPDSGLGESSVEGGASHWK